MNIASFKIGYSPYSVNCKAPGDRRRFMFYAAVENLNVEVADPSRIYDVVYITSSANISQWINYKKKHPAVKLIFEIIDSYLLEDTSLYLYLKGASRLLTKRETKLYLDYRNAFISIIKIADAVVCSTVIQKEDITRYNANVHVSLDYFSDDITYHKTNYKAGDKIKIAWEGMAYTVNNLLKLKDVFHHLSNRVELQVITDPKIRYPFKFLNKKTTSLLSELSCEWQFHEWKQNSFSKLISEMDIAVIPIDTANSLTVNKPENKLLLLWEIGIPVIVSNTPAYSRVMKAAGLEAYCCGSENEWLEKIKSLIEKAAEGREEYMKKAKHYLANYHTKQILLSNWENIFNSVL